MPWSSDPSGVECLPTSVAQGSGENRPLRHARHPEHGTLRSHLAWKSCILALQSPERIRDNQNTTELLWSHCSSSIQYEIWSEESYMCLSIPLKYFVQEVWDINTGDSSIKSAAAITSRYQADQSWIKRNFYANFAKFFPIHFCNCFKNINKHTCPLIEEWSWSRALQPFSCPHVVALKFPLSNFCYSNPPPPSWQLYELLILKEMHGNATS